MQKLHRRSSPLLAWMIPLGIVAVGLLAGVGLSVPPEANAQGGPPVRLRQFYLTITKHDGAAALTACEPGFHMASMWEILDPSNLEYDTTLGATQDDSGSGPPNDFDGWMRTGNNASGGGSAGSANCNAWSSNDNADEGTTAELVQSGWEQGAREPSFVAPWAASTRACDAQNRVWCVEDLGRAPQED